MPLDATPVLSVLDRVTDDNGNPVSGAVLYFYEAGTSTAKTVYADAGLSVSLGVTVTCDASGYPTSNGTTRTLIYVGTASYKVIVKTSTGTTIATHDNIPGAPDIPDAQEVALPETPVVSRTSNYTILSTDQGKLINADCTSGTIALTLPSAVTVGDGWRVGVRHAGTANVVTVRSIAAHTIASPGQSSATSHSLIGRGHTRWYVSDGAGWTVDSEVPPLMGGPLPWFKVQDRLTAPPASPVGGNRYIINGTPTGTWATLSFAEHDVAESDGNGSWFKYTPAAGWLAYVVDEDLVTQHDGTEWDDWDNVRAPNTSIEKSLFAVNALPAGTNGGTNTATTWTNLALNTTAANTITGASHNTGAYTVTLPNGNYRVTARAAFYQTGATLIRFKSGSTATELLSETMYIPTGTDAMAHVELSGVISVGGASETFSLQYFTGTSKASSGLGLALSVPGVVERYVTLEITDIASQQGPTGAQGPQGDGGLDAAYSYKWVTATTGDPGTGAIRGNNATIASITQIALSETDYQSTGLASVIDSWDDSTSSIKGTLKLAKEGATNNFWSFKITGTSTDHGTYRSFPVTYVASGGTLANNDICALLFIEKGDIGDPGTTTPDPSGLSVLARTTIAKNDKVLVYDVSASATKVYYPSNYPVFNVDNPEFGAVGDGVTDDAGAFDAAYAAAVAAGGGIVEASAKSYAVSHLPNLAGFGVTLRGAGRYATYIKYTATTGDCLTIDGNYCAVEDLTFTPTVRKTSGFAIRIAAGKGNAIRRVATVYEYNGVAVTASSNIANAEIDGLEVLYALGDYAVVTYGASGSAGVFGLTLEHVSTNNPWPGTIGTAGTRKAWATSTVYSLNDVVSVNGRVYQCTTGGTSSGAGTGPSGLPAGSDPASAFSGTITDGTAAWKFVHKVGLTGLAVDNYANSIRTNGDVAFLNPYYGIVIADTAATGSSYPRYFHFYNVEVDHPYSDAINLGAGSAVFLSTCWLGYSLTGNGVTIAAGFTGEFAMATTKCVGHWSNGVQLAAGPIGTIVTASYLDDNAQAGSGLGYGFLAQAGATDFSVVGNHCGNGTDPTFTNNQAYGVAVAAGASDRYAITGNIVNGNVTGGVSDGGTGTDKEVFGNPGATGGFFRAKGTVVKTEAALTLANGVNSDVALPEGSFITITGPTGGFSVTGFASPVNGREITLYNSTSQNMTITNDATSTAANRILTLTGADVALTGTSLARFVYSAVSSRWILTGTQG